MWVKLLITYSSLTKRTENLNLNLNIISTNEKHTNFIQVDIFNMIKSMTIMREDFSDRTILDLPHIF